MSRPGFSFLICPDVELLRQEMDHLVATYGDGATWVRRVYWADDGDLPGSFWQDLTIPDLMGTSRLVIIRRANTFLVDTWNKLETALASAGSTIWPIFCLEGALDKKGSPKVPKTLTKQKYWAVAEKRGWVWSSPGLTRRTLPDFVRSYAKRNGLDIAPDVLRALTDALPTDALGARSELDKLALAAGDAGTVTRDHLTVIAAEADMDVFEFISMLQSGATPERVWKKVFDNRMVSSSDNILFSFLALLQRDARIMWELAHGEKPSAWVPQSRQRAMTTTAKRLGPARLSRIWDLTMEAEFGIKSGERTPEQAFEAIVGGLYTVFQDAKPAGMR